MSTWYDDLKKSNPALAADYAIVGAGQDRTSLRHMVKALETFGGFMNSDEDNKRLAAAKRILKTRKA